MLCKYAEFWLTPAAARFTFSTSDAQQQKSINIVFETKFKFNFHIIEAVKKAYRMLY